jgi:integral membrane protein
MSPRLLFRTFATAEVITWAGLITALILRATGVTDIVGIAGGIHGFVFLSYGVVTVFVWVNEKWRPSVGIVGLVSAVIPFATLPFELVADRRGLLSRSWRLAEGGETPSGFIEHVQAWVLRHLILSIVILVCGVTIVFVVLLWLGPPIPQS